MANDKFDDFEERFKSDMNDSAVRARNRTVMLTPEITGKVRARLTRDSDAEEASHAFAEPESENEFLAPAEIFDNSQADPEFTDNGTAGFESKISSQVSARGGVSPIARETHQIPIIERRSVTADDSLRNIAPQRREMPAAGDNYNSQEIESSLPYLSPIKHQPSFDDRADKIEQDKQMTQGLVWAKLTPVVGFLVSFDNDENGEVFFLRSGRVIVSSEVPSGGNYLLLDDDSVSPMHAILKITEDAQIQVLDNLSEYGTNIVRPATGEEISLSGDKSMVNHGDLLRFGKRSFAVCLIGSQG